MGLLRPDSEFMEFLGKAADFIILNVVCVLCSIPVITIGAAMTARNYAAMKIVRGEEPDALKSFFKSFRDNFRQITGIWMAFLLIYGVIIYDWYCIFTGSQKNLPLTLKVLFAFLTFLFWAGTDCLFYLEARFEMESLRLVKTALAMALMNLPRMFFIGLVTFLPYVICAWYLEWGLGIWFLCTGVSLFYISRGWDKLFSKILERGKV